MLRTLQLLMVKISLVKGYQDKAKLKQPLMILEMLNIDCDKQASAAMLTFPTTTLTNHPMTTTGYPIFSSME